MPSTPKLAILELEIGQDGTTVLNAATRELEQFAGRAIVREIDRTAPPGGPAEGDSYWVLPTATGVWTGHDNDIAYYENGAWSFQTITDGWLIEDQETGELWRWTGAARQRALNRQYTLTILAPTSSEDRTIVNIGTLPLTLVEVEAVCVGTTPSVTWTLRSDTDRSATGTAEVTGQVTTNTTTGDLVTVGTTIPANSFLWLETTAVSGTIAEIHFTFRCRAGR